MNLFTTLFLCSLGASIIVQWILVQRHIKHIQANRQTVPDEFSDKIPLEAHQKAADYTRAKVKTGMTELIIGAAFLLIWTLAGGLQLLDEFLRSFELPELATGTLFILAVFGIMSILDLPLSLYRTFKLEQSFGFNKMTLNVFFMDMIKNTILGLLIGTPLLLLILWFMANAGQYWWLYAWISVITFVLFFTWAYPAFIAPMFNKFTPLDNEELKTKIETLLSKNGFKSQGVYVMDGSLRSTHGNAYFAGFGNNKRIVFFDTLIDTLNYDEIEAVLAHELGHFKCNHVKKLTVLQAFLYFVAFAVLGWLSSELWFFNGLGVEQQSNYMALTLFILVASTFTFFLTPLIKMLTRKYEFEADDFAVAQADSKDLIQALVTLYKENASTLTPDPLYSAFHDSHPPAPIRIAHLKSAQAV